MENGLQVPDDVTVRSLLKQRHRPAVGERMPGSGADDAIDAQRIRLLELAYRPPRL
jgi:hypothetical protein